MNEKLNGIFSYLDMTSKTGLASDEYLNDMTSYQRLFYNQVKSKIGVDAVYFLRDSSL